MCVVSLLNVNSKQHKFCYNYSIKFSLMFRFEKNENNKLMFRYEFYFNRMLFSFNATFYSATIIKNFLLYKINIYI